MHQKQNEKQEKNKRKRTELPFHGEVSCQFQGCSNGGYWAVKRNKGQDPEILCGVHSRKEKKARVALVKDKKATQSKNKKELDARLQVVETEAQANRESKKHGHVITTKLKMLKNPRFEPGYLSVWPSYRHQKKPGFGCRALSPMSLPAPDHTEALFWVRASEDASWEVMDRADYDPLSGMETKLESLPPALSIENYHQFSKCFKHEEDPETGWPRLAFWTQLRDAYQDPEPKRHKWDKKQLPKGNPNVPLYTCRSDRTGTWHKFSYVESRVFYCRMYERHATQTVEFKQLQEKLQQGINLEILGYDAFRVRDNTPKVLDEHYQDGSRPFGHEMVLLCLLTIPKSEEYPWNRYAKAHPGLYAAFS